MKAKIILVAAMPALLGAVLVVESFIHSAFGLYPAHYWTGNVTALVDPELPTSRVRHIRVASDEKPDQDVIVKRMDNRKFQIGDTVFVCQPFGPPHVEPPLQGRLFCQITRYRLAFPMAVAGVRLWLTSVGCATVVIFRKTMPNPRSQSSLTPQRGENVEGARSSHRKMI